MQASIEMVKKVRVGRPSKAQAEKQTNVPVRFPPAMIEAIDEERAARLDAPDRSAMIRELVALGLKHIKRSKTP